jgi:hypothetical protein
MTDVNHDITPQVGMTSVLGEESREERMERSERQLSVDG